MKIDLSKAYDKVNWLFLRLVLFQIGLSLQSVNWIMGCVESANFAVLINGSPSGFFKASRGLKQECPLSPFPFLLVAEGLNRLIAKAKQNGFFRGIQVTKSIEVTHLLFVDDILLFGRGNLREQSYLKTILDLFCKATGMEINMNKSCILANGLSDAFLRRLEQLFPMKIEPLDVGVKYLGFHLKPNNYKKDDWTWLIKKMEDIITYWCNRWLSQGGRLVLVKYVLESILIYWLSIAHVPKGILD
jgi:hypothetical protein